MTLRFDGKVALVTGAGRGLGRAYCEWLAARGAAVVINNRKHADRPSAADELAESIRRAGGKAVADTHAVEEESGGQGMLETALRHFGRLDILVCNAAVSEPAQADEISLESFRRVMDINFWGSMYPLLAALPRMYEQDYGRILLTSSANGLFGAQGSIHYAASKSAILGVVRTLLLETAKRKKNVKANVITPYAYTSMTRSIPPSLHERMDPQQVARVVGWLSSDACDRNGNVYCAGGGRVRRVFVHETAPVDLPADDDLSGVMAQLDAGQGLVASRNAAESAFGLVPELLSAADRNPQLKR